MAHLIAPASSSLFHLPTAHKASNEESRTWRKLLRYFDDDKNGLNEPEHNKSKGVGTD